MTFRTVAGLAFACLFALAASAPAQDARPPGGLACEPSGVTARLTPGPGAASDSPRPAPAPLSLPLDTTIRLAITDRTWQRDDLSAGVALGVAGRTAAGAPWNACAGVAAQLGRATVRLRNVHGIIRLRIDAGALDAVGRASPSTPPAGSTRR